jgi:hypothetical protein
MLSFTIFSFFALTSGRRMQTVKPGATIQMWHAHYTTTIQCINPPYLPTDLRIHSPMNEMLHPENTIAFIIVRVHVPQTGNVLLDAVHIAMP